MKHGVLKHWHPMIGVDWHIPWPPGAPSPAPSAVPYRTFDLLIGLTITSKFDKTQLTDSYAMSMFKGTDIGPLIPHVGPPSITLPIEMVFSASKSHFGSSRYKGGPSGEDIYACSLLTVLNPNLNCGTPVPTPTGFVFALTTHRVDMSFGDIFAGLLGMLADFALQAILNKLGGKLGGYISGKFQQKLFEKYFPKMLLALLTKGAYKGATGQAAEFAAMYAGIEAAAAAEKAVNWIGTGIGTVFGFFVGGPMGADIGAKPFYGYNRDEKDPFTPGGWLGNQGGSASDAAGQALGKALDDYLAAPDDPDVGDFPAADPNAPAMA